MSEGNNTFPTQPVPGRIVHYRSYGSPGGEFAPECRPAIVTETGLWMPVGPPDPHPDIEGHRLVEEEFVPDAIKVMVVNPTGLFFNAVLHEEPEQPGAVTSGGTWHWPCVRQGSR